MARNVPLGHLGQCQERVLSGEEDANNKRPCNQASNTRHDYIALTVSQYKEVQLVRLYLGFAA